ncbi:MAG: hypothetical protein E6J21_15185 [Chloroflexota bacterium]|nr:MAG: hypothetical protein E6J21_15185 [Chloroflexota bacterium]
MPAFLTHWRILIETAQRSQDVGNNLGSLIIDASALRHRVSEIATPPQTTPASAVWHTGPLPKIDMRFPGSDISAMAFLGAMAPDVTTFQRRLFRQKISGGRQQNPQTATEHEKQWAPLLHCNRSGDVLLAFLELTANIPSPAGAYTINDVPGIFTPLGLHFYVELCLDEYLAGTYFRRPLYRWLQQPWREYIEPAAGGCLMPRTLSAQVLDLLSDALEVTYGLTQELRYHYKQSFLAGLRSLRRYLAGQGIFQVLTFNVLTRKRENDPIIASIAGEHHEPGSLNVEQVIAYAIRLSEHLCRRAIGYYVALRNTSATASERNQQRTALCEDLRNWNLRTGYTVEVSFDQEITLRLLHNWIHFARLWEDEMASVAQGFGLNH